MPYQIIRASEFQSASSGRIANSVAISHRQAVGTFPSAPARCSRTRPEGSTVARSTKAAASPSGCPCGVPTFLSTSSRTPHARTDSCGSLSRWHSHSGEAAPTACAAHRPRSRRVGSACVSAIARSSAAAAERSRPATCRSERIRRACLQNQSLECNCNRTNSESVAADRSSAAARGGPACEPDASSGLAAEPDWPRAPSIPGRES